MNTESPSLSDLLNNPTRRPGYAQRSSIGDMNLRQWLIEYIERAFNGVSLADGTSIYRGESIDSYGDPNEDALDATAERIDWRRVPTDDLFARNWAIHHLDARGFRFYTPAIMNALLRCGIGNGMLSDTFLFRLGSISGGCMIGDTPFRILYNRSQRAAIVRFLKFAIHNAPREFGYDDARRALCAVRACALPTPE